MEPLIETIVGIDPGTRNFGIVVYSQKKIQRAEVWDLLHNRKRPSWPFLVLSLEKKMKNSGLWEIFNQPSTILAVEGGQIGVHNNCLVAWMKGKWPNLHMVTKRTYCPEAITGNYNENKAVTIRLTEDVWCQVQKENPQWCCPSYRLHHLADAYLIVMWAKKQFEEDLSLLEDNYNNKQEEEEKEEEKEEEREVNVATALLLNIRSLYPQRVFLNKSSSNQHVEPLPSLVSHHPKNKIK